MATVARTVEWDFPADKEDLVNGFRIKIGDISPGNYNLPDININIKSQRSRVLSLDTGKKYYSVIVSYDGSGELPVDPNGQELVIDLVGESPTNYRLATPA